MGQHGKHRKLVGRLALAGLLAVLAGGAAAQECRLALSLGLDVSSSVDAAEYALQRGGLIAALGAPEVRRAFFAVPGSHVALHIFEWSGQQRQMVQQEWVAVETQADLDAVRARLAGQRRSAHDYPTALGAALGFGAVAIAKGPRCADRVLDISGDGANNDGFPPQSAHAAFPLEDVRVNGLVIGPNHDVLGRYYEQFVIRGYGAFVEHAEDHGDFERAMRRKLERELRALQLSDAAR